MDPSTSDAFTKPRSLSASPSAFTSIGSPRGVPASTALQHVNEVQQEDQDSKSSLHKAPPVPCRDM
jgi:hypothetical protein